MASAATSSPPTTATLPSIHDLLPDHLFETVDAYRAPVSSAALQPRRQIELFRTPPQVVAPQLSVPRLLGNQDTFGVLDHAGGVSEQRKHVCSQCGKRFNRPSSLRIHQNTHTGDKPFPCPFPGCGRSFNVSSNMRRHYRNHATGSQATSPSTAALPTFHGPLYVPPSNGSNARFQDCADSGHRPGSLHDIAFHRHHPYTRPYASTASDASVSPGSVSSSLPPVDEQYYFSDETDFGNGMPSTDIPPSSSFHPSHASSSYYRDHTRTYSHSYPQAYSYEREAHSHAPYQTRTAPLPQQDQTHHSSHAYHAVRRYEEAPTPMYTYPPPAPPSSALMSVSAMVAR